MVPEGSIDSKESKYVNYNYVYAYMYCMQA